MMKNIFENFKKNNMDCSKHLILSGVLTLPHPNTVKYAGKAETWLIYDIPVTLWSEYFSLAQKLAPFTISVGSGHGSIERFLQMTLWPIPIIVPVDPEPDSFIYVRSCHKLPVLTPPMFNVIDELIQLNPSLIGHVNVTLIWPSPITTDNKKPYDMEAIEKLKPRGVFALFGVDGSSGSRDFRRWIKTQTDYVVVRRCESISISTSTLFCHPDVIKKVLIVLIRKDCTLAALKPVFSVYNSQEDFDIAHRYFDEAVELAKLDEKSRNSILQRQKISRSYASLSKLMNEGKGNKQFLAHALHCLNYR